MTAQPGSSAACWLSAGPVLPRTSGNQIALQCPPKVVVADLAGARVVGAPTGGAGNETEVVRVAALTAPLAHALDKVVADGIGAPLGSNAVEHLWGGEKALGDSSGGGECTKQEQEHPALRSTQEQLSSTKQQAVKARDQKVQ